MNRQDVKTNNTPSSNTLQHPNCVIEYINHGWKLIPITKGSKGPTHKGWNEEQNVISSPIMLHKDQGVGLAHAYSGTMALDIDDWDRAAEELAKHNINLYEIYDALDAVIIDSGRSGHGKLLYKMPAGLVLNSKKLIDTDHTGKKYNYLDFRCSTSNGKTVQDVLPPSIHPDTNQPYRWAGKGNWKRLPEIPFSLLLFWQSLLVEPEIKQAEVLKSEVNWEDIKHALSYIPADISRDEWIHIGMALHHAGHLINQLEHALTIWNEWSMTAPAKYQPQSLLSAWKSFSVDSNSITLNTLYKIAIDHGYRKVENVSNLFSQTQTSTQTQSQYNFGDITLPVELLDVEPPHINLNLFPNVLARRAQEVSDSVGCDPLVPLLAGLSTVCAVANAESRLYVNEQFKVPPILWLMTIGNPSDKKSPGSRPMFEILHTLESERLKQYKEELSRYKADCKIYDIHYKEYIQHQSLMLTTENTVLPPLPKEPEKPVKTKYIVSDITSQMLCRVCAERPEGVLALFDELSSWIKKMIDPKSGDDRASWIAGYEGGQHSVLRVGDGDITISNFAVSIYGNIQPEIYKKSIRKLREDGLLQRFVPALLNPNLTRYAEPLPKSLTNEEDWSSLIRLISSLPANNYQLSKEASDAMVEFRKDYERKKANYAVVKSGLTFMTAFGKIEGLAARLAFILHIIEEPFSTIVSADILTRTVDIMNQFIIPSLETVFIDMAGESGTREFEVWLMEWILQYSDVEELTLTDIKQAARSHKYKLEDNSSTNSNALNKLQYEEAIRGVITTLEKHNWMMKKINTRANEAYIINPDLQYIMKERRELIIKAKQEIYNARHESARRKDIHFEKRYAHGYKKA